MSSLAVSSPRFPASKLTKSTRPVFCCGSAGVYNLLHPEPANQLGDRKVENLLAAESQAVISANPGLPPPTDERPSPSRPWGYAAFHMVELLDASIRGIPPAEIALRIEAQNNHRLTRERVLAAEIIG